MRVFSGGHDPYWLHLHHQHDNYPQYAHLHWHTVDLLEIGKYAKERSLENFGNHVSEDPATIQWFADLGDLKTMDADSRNKVYHYFNRWSEDFPAFLDENIDYVHDGDHKLSEGANNVFLSVMEPEQIHKAIDVAQGLIDEYKTAGVPVTKEAIREKINLFMIKNLTKHQVHDLKEGMMEYLEYFGVGIPLNED